MDVTVILQPDKFSADNKINIVKGLYETEWDGKLTHSHNADAERLRKSLLHTTTCVALRVRVAFFNTSRKRPAYLR